MSIPLFEVQSFLSGQCFLQMCFFEKLNPEMACDILSESNMQRTNWLLGSLDARCTDELNFLFEALIKSDVFAKIKSYHFFGFRQVVFKYLFIMAPQLYFDSTLSYVA